MNIHPDIKRQKQFHIPALFFYIGIAGLLLLFLLSFIVPSYQLIPSVVSEEITIMGNVSSPATQLYIPKKVHSFPVFLSYYRLEFFAVILLFLTVTGLFSVFRKRPAL